MFDEPWKAARAADPSGALRAARLVAEALSLPLFLVGCAAAQGVLWVVVDAAWARWG